MDVRLLHLIGTLDPSYGGPVAVLTQFVTGCTEFGIEPEIVTLDSPADAWIADFPGVVHALGPSYGRYRYCPRLRPWLRDHLGAYDAVVVHGIWQYQSRTARAACGVAGAPYFLFVHGALDPWFKRQYPRKHAKKALYWRLAEARVLREARAVLFTCEEERRLARLSFRPYGATEAIARLGIEEPAGDPGAQRQAFLEAYDHLRDKRVLLFLSRIHPKKGCDLLIQAFATACAGDDRLRLVVAGPDEVRWQVKLTDLADALGVSDRITWTGMLAGQVKWGAYRAADAFVLPSHSENFGMVVPEALACGLPVLITDKVNIWREIDRAGAGLIDEDTVAGATALLERWLSLPEDETDRMRRHARACFMENFELQGAAAGFAELIARAVGKGGTG